MLGGTSRTSKTWGWALFLLGLVTAGYGTARWVRPELVPAANLPGNGATILGVGALVLIAGVVLLTRGAPKAPVVATPPVQPAGEEIVIKRTDMGWDVPGKSDGSDIDDRLDDVQRRMGKLKVEFGLGRMSPESYKRLMQTLETEAAELEQAKFERDNA